MYLCLQIIIEHKWGEKILKEVKDREGNGITQENSWQTNWRGGGGREPAGGEERAREEERKKATNEQSIKTYV